MKLASVHCIPFIHLTSHTYSSIARAASALVNESGVESAGGQADDDDDGPLVLLLHHLTALADEAQTKGTAGLLQVQAAAQAWAVLAGGALGGGGAGGGERVVAALEAERVFLAEAFRVVPGAAGGEDDQQEQEQERRRERVRRQLRAMGRRAAVGRARAESLLGRLFLRQCAVAEALRRLEECERDGGGEDAWRKGLGEEEEAAEELLRAVGVDMRGEAAALAATWREGNDDGGDERSVEGREEGPGRLSLSIIGDEHHEEECRGRVEEGPAGGAVVFDSSGDGEREEGRGGSPTTSGESQEEEEDVLEVFEGTADSPGRGKSGVPRRQQGDDGGGLGPEHERLDQGTMLLGELSRVLQGRERRGQQPVVKVNGQRMASYASPPPTITKEAPQPVVAMPTAQGPAALAAGLSLAGLQDALMAQRLKNSVALGCAQEEEVFGE